MIQCFAVDVRERLTKSNALVRPAVPQCCQKRWQITPVALIEAITDPDPAAAKRAFDAMMDMKKIDVAKIEAAIRG